MYSVLKFMWQEDDYKASLMKMGEEVWCNDYSDIWIAVKFVILMMIIIIMIVMFDLLKIIMIINSNSHYSNSNDSMCWGWSMPSYRLVTHLGHLSFFFLCMRGGWHPRMVPQDHHVETSLSHSVTLFLGLNVKLIKRERVERGREGVLTMLQVHA